MHMIKLMILKEHWFHFDILILDWSVEYGYFIDMCVSAILGLLKYFWCNLGHRVSLGIYANYVPQLILKYKGYAEHSSSLSIPPQNEHKDLAFHLGILLLDLNHFPSSCYSLSLNKLTFNFHLALHYLLTNNDYHNKATVQYKYVLFDLYEWHIRFWLSVLCCKSYRYGLWTSGASGIVNKPFTSAHYNMNYETMLNTQKSSWMQKWLSAVNHMLHPC